MLPRKIFLAPADLEHVYRLGAVLYGKRFTSGNGHAVAARLGGGVAHQYLAASRVRLKPRGKVHRIADRGVFRTLIGAHIADRGLASVEADAHRDLPVAFGPQFVVQRPKPFLHRHGRLYGIQGIFLRRGRRTEDRHQAVADVFIQRSAVLEDDLRHCGEKAIKEVNDLFRVRILRKRGKAADVREKDRDLLVNAAEPERTGVFQQLFHHVFGHEAAVVRPGDLFAGKAFMCLYRFNRHGGLSGYRTDKFQVVRREGRERIEPVSIDHAVDIRFGDQRSTDRGPDALRNDRFDTRELGVFTCVLRKQRNLVLHHLLRDGPAYRHALRQPLDILVTSLHRHGVEAIFDDLAVESFVRDECDNPVSRGAPKDKVRRLFKKGFQVKDGPECFAHFIEQFKDFRFPAEVFDLFRRCDAGLHRKVGLPADDLVRRYLQLRLAERLVIVGDAAGNINGSCRRNVRRRRNAGRQLYGGMDRRHRSGDRHFRRVHQFRFADDDHVTVFQLFLERLLAVHEYVIYAADKLAILNIPVDNLKTDGVGCDASVLPRNPSVVKNYVVFFCPANRKAAAGDQIQFPLRTCRVGDLKKCVHDIRYCKWFTSNGKLTTPRCTLSAGLIRVIYLDNNATTEVVPGVFAAMRPFLEGGFGNPSSSHSLSRDPAEMIGSARESVAALVGARLPSEIIFTSGGTESDNWAIIGALKANPDKKHVITTSVEHEAVRKLCRALESDGYQVTWLGVDEKGAIDPEELRASLTEKTAVVSIMTANNETGVLFNVSDAARIVKENSAALFHTDAVNAAGKVPINAGASHIDLLSISAHKFHGPKGIGALYVRSGTAIPRFFHGGGQENGMRPGTEAVHQIAGMGAAAEYVRDLGPMERVRELRKRLEDGLLAAVPDSSLNGTADEWARLPNTTNISFPGANGDAILARLDNLGIYVSTGSACNSAAHETSPVLQAMNVPYAKAMGSIRFSLGRFNTEEEVETVLDVFPPIISELRSIAA